MLIYLAQTIDRSKDSPQVTACNIIKEFRALGFKGTFFASSLAFSTPELMYVVQQDIEHITDINFHALSMSDALLLNYTPGMESWGCPQEVYVANLSKIPIFILTPEGTRYQEMPLYLRGLTNSTCVNSNLSNLLTRILTAPKRIHHE